MKWKIKYDKRKRKYVRKLDLDIDEWISLIMVILALIFVGIRLLIGKV